VEREFCRRGKGVVWVTRDRRDRSRRAGAARGPIREPEPDFDAELHTIYIRHESQRIGIICRLGRAWKGAIPLSTMSASATTR
jgi:hypothetical protein